MDQDRLSRAIVGLAELMERLRGPGGCPWDAKQTDSTVKSYLLEEAYEVLEAVETCSPREVCSELGDLLFQILFLARLAEEREEFDFTEVVERIREKMIRRHPHVFKGKKVRDADEVARNWARIKNSEEIDGGGHTASLYNVPLRLPALMRAHRLCERASKAGLECTAQNMGINGSLMDKVERVGLPPSDSENEEGQFKEEFGDLLFLLADFARKKGFNAEELLRDANQKFLHRFERMENLLKEEGVEPANATEDQLSRAWVQAGQKNR